MANTKTRRRYVGDRTRRGRWLDCVQKSGVSRGAVAWAVTLSQRSNAQAKPVWGYQTGQAAEIRCTDRTVRRYRVELEQAGLIETVRGKVERRPDGTFARTMTNLYKFIVEPLVRRKKSSSYRPDTDDRTNPFLTEHIQTLPERRQFKTTTTDDQSAAPPPLLAEPNQTALASTDAAPWCFSRRRFEDARSHLRKTEEAPSAPQ